MQKSGYLFLLLSMILNREMRAQYPTDSTLILYFETARFVPPAAETEKLLSLLQDRRFIIKKISGHTDTVGSAASNMALSQKRSKAVAGFLKDHFHMSFTYPIENYGEQKPLQPDNNALNRRVELVLQFLDGHPKTHDSAGYHVWKTYNFNRIYFVPNQPWIEASSLPYLDQVADILKTYPDEKFEIRGHVNWPLWSVRGKDSGYRKKMDQLSTDRAKAVYEMLLTRGIFPERMSYRGMGNTQMVYPNARTKEEQLENMRVEILVLKKSDSSALQ